MARYIFLEDLDSQGGEVVVGVEGLLPPVALVLKHHDLEVRVRALQLATQLEPDGTMPAALVLDHEQPP